jgi:hypothetical protein
MKRYIFLILFVCFDTFCLFSQSNLIFYNPEGEKFYVILNDIEQNIDPAVNVKIINVKQSFFKLRIVFDDNSIQDINISIQFNPYTETVFAITKNKKGNPALKWQSEVSLEEASNTTPNQVVIYYAETLNRKPVNKNTDSNKTQDTSNINQTGTITNLNAIDSSIKITVIPLTDTNSNSKIYNGAIGCTSAINDKDFQQIRQNISSKTTDKDKLDFARQLVPTKCLLVSQIKDIMLLFSTEDMQVEFAKTAYGYTYDLDNYYLLNEAFKSDTSIDELNNFISTH